MLALGNQDDSFCISQENFAWIYLHSVKTGRSTWPRHMQAAGPVLQKRQHAGSEHRFGLGWEPAESICPLPESCFFFSQTHSCNEGRL